MKICNHDLVHSSCSLCKKTEGGYTKKYEQIHSTVGGDFNETHSF